MTKHLDSHNTPRPRRWGSLLLAGILCACFGDAAPSEGAGSGPRPKKEKFTGKVQGAKPDRGKEGKPFEAEPYARTGYSLKLSDAPVSETVSKKPKAPKATVLSAKEVEKLLARLPDMERAHARDFAFRKDSLKRPKAGNDITTPFPPKTKRPRPLSSVVKVKKEALRVLRYSPEGAVAHIPKVSITFSAPMVPLSSLDIVHERKVPAKISPPIKGEWRWLDTQTLQFIPKKAFSLSTLYTVRVAAGTRSTLGTRLAKSHAFKFETPRNQFTYGQPQGNQNGLQPTITVAFSQPLTMKSVLRLLKVRAAGRTYKLTFADKQPVTPDKTHGGVAQVALRLDRPLPKNTAVVVTIASRIPSVHGPLKSKAGGKFSFSTYPPFKVIRSSCGSYKCRPQKSTSFSIELSNSMEPTTFAAAEVEVTPQPENMKISGSGNYISVVGDPAPNTKYRVRLPTRLRDAWGQKLSGKRTFTFKTTAFPKLKPQPWLNPTHSRMLVLDPDAPRTYEVKSKNHKLTIELYKVRPEDWFKYQDEFVSRFWHWDKKVRPSARMPGRKVQTKVIPIDAKPDEERKIEIDLSPALENGIGQMVLLVKGVDNDRSHVAWIQATKLGVTTYVDQERVTAFVSRLKGGLPVRGARLALHTRSGPGFQSARTTSDGRGVAHFSFQKDAVLLRAEKDGDIVFLHQSFFGSPYQKERRLFWYVIDDRKLYRPGETVRIKGWVRVLDLGKGGDLSVPHKALKKVRYRLVDGQYNELKKGTFELNRLGGFNLEFKLADNVNLGLASLNLNVEGSHSRHHALAHTHRFKVEEFRRPEFEVDIVPDEPYLMSRDIIVPVRARYYSGGPLPFAKTNWRVQATPASFVPPNMSDYKFGRSPPRWFAWWGPPSYRTGGHYRSAKRSRRRHRRPYLEGLTPTLAGVTHEAQTGKYGVHRLKVDLEGTLPPWPLSLSMESKVTDVNRQQWVANANIMVHPSAAYLGLRAPRSFVQAGGEILVDAIVSDLTGNAKKDYLVDIRGFLLLNEQDKNGNWRQVMKEAQVCHLTSTARATRCVFRAKRGGTFMIRGIVRDPREKILSATEIAVWVAGAQPKGQDRQLTKQQVFLLTDRDDYAPGDVAEVLVQAPFPKAEGILTVRRSGIISEHRFSMEKSSHVLNIPIKDEHIPGLSIQVDVFSEVARVNEKGEPDLKLPKRPAYAGGNANLKVLPATRTLKVEAVPKAKVLEPGSSTSITVHVKDHRGRPVKGAEVALMAADEAVLALAGYTLPDPLATFFPDRRERTRSFYLRQHLILTGKPVKPRVNVERPEISGMSLDDAGGGGDVAESVPSSEAKSAPRRSKKRSRAGGKAGPSGPTAKKTVKMRKTFGALLVFEPALSTDSSGRTVVKVKLPDTLTRYRIMAVAVEGGRRFGKGESSLRAKKELMVRPSPPRFLNFGDKAELPIVVQNLKEQPTSVRVAIRTDNAKLPGPRGYVVKVPAEDRVELRFPLTTERPGRARFQVIAASANHTDAAELGLPVWSPATSEAFATYGTIDEGAVLHRVVAPKDATELFGGLEITTSATALAELTDAFLYLVSYPYDCSEQISSRLLGIASLKDILKAFEAPGLPKEDELFAAVAEDIKALERRQNSDGGWDYWRHDSVPYVSIHVAHALERAKKKGFEVPPRTHQRALNYLQNIDSNIRAYESRHRFTYDSRTRNALVAYALYVRAVAGQNASKRAKKILKSPGLKRISLETAGWLLATLARNGGNEKERATISRFIHNRVEETASRAHFVTSYGKTSHWLLHSARRSDAVLLDALISSERGNDLIPKIVRGLLAHRLKGRWRNTQENVFVLVALEHYFSMYESVTPDFVARAWLGESYAGDQKFKGRSGDRQNLLIPMTVVKEGPPSKELLLQKEGAGRLYYRLGMKYAPINLQLDPLDRGFAVSRTYEAVDSPDDVQRAKDGSWRIKAGATVRIRLTMQASSQRYFVALVDKMPAGFEPQNPALAGTTGVGYQAARQNYGYYWWSTHWFQHQNLRDERVEAFASQLWPGQFTYTYLARATTPGTFIAPPAKAEEMYTPETFGRSKSELVVIQ